MTKITKIIVFISNDVKNCDNCYLIGEAEVIANSNTLVFYVLDVTNDQKSKNQIGVINSNHTRG